MIGPNPPRIVFFLLKPQHRSAQVDDDLAGRQFNEAVRLLNAADMPALAGDRAGVGQIQAAVITQACRMGAFVDRPIRHAECRKV